MSTVSEGRRSAGVRIDDAILRFRDARARARSLPKSHIVWSQIWQATLIEIASATATAPKASDLGAFVRARVTLEVELDVDRRRRVRLPDDIDVQVSGVLGAVDESVSELRAANAPGTTLAPLHRSEAEGDLILRAPLFPLLVSSPFGTRADPFSGVRRFHAGVDFEAPHGTPVYAAASGVVVWAGRQGGYGNHVVIDHGDGVRTHYSHLSDIDTEIGAFVKEGDAVGFVGSTGRSTGPHLHFGVTDDSGEFMDPLALLDVPFANQQGQVRTSGNIRVRPIPVHGNLAMQRANDGAVELVQITSQRR